MAVVDKTITEDGLLVKKMADGTTIKSCLTDECIQNRTNGDSTMSSDKCNCEECTSKRIEKDDDEYGNKETLSEEEIEELRQKLPAELFAEVTEYVEADRLDEAPEDPEEVGKSLAKSLYDSRPDPVDGIPASNHLGNARDEESYSGGTPGSPEVYAESVVEKNSVNLEKADSAETPANLDRFYESQGEEL